MTEDRAIEASMQRGKTVIYSGICRICSEVFFIPYKATSGFCSISCRAKTRVGPLSASWRGGRRIDRDGYIDVAAPDHPFVAKSGYVKEHRLVMERSLGRYLRPHESVHHINGIRADNNTENLQLWTRPQPAGQRPEDLVAWVVREYPNEVRTQMALNSGPSIAVWERT